MKNRRTTGRRATKRQIATQLYRDFSAKPSPTSLAFARAAEAEATERLCIVDWAGVSGARLIALVEQWTALLREQRELLPPSVTAKLTAQERFGLFIHWVWRRHRRDRRERVARAVIYAMAGPRALDEVERRFDDATGQVGLWPAVWFLVARWRDYYDGETDPADAEIAGITNRLARIARRHVRTDQRATDGDLAGAVAETLLRRFGGLHPLDAVARALDGDLNIVPKAIGEATSDHVTRGLPQSRARRRRRAVIGGGRSAPSASGACARRGGRAPRLGAQGRMRRPCHRARARSDWRA
jgi:hypothetical protein